MSWRYKQLLTVGGMCLGALLAPTAHALTWTGTADYSAVIGSGGDTVGPFDAYDFASGGVVLIRPTSATTFEGHYQSYVTSHMLGSATVNSPNLNTTGTGPGYELTVVANFTESVIATDNFGNPTFGVTGGELSIYLDSTANRNFQTDSGFNDGERILHGVVTGGSGSYLQGSGVGFGSIDLKVDNYNKDVFDPDTIAGSQGVFTLRLNPTGQTAGITSVAGVTVGPNDLKLEADGNMNLLAVPLPAPVWLLGVALAGLAVTARRGSNGAGNGNLVPTMA